jgi:hypothetical protein
MKINLQIRGLEKVQKELGRLGARTPDAFASAVTDTAYQAKRAIQKNMRSRFDSPTAYVTKNLLVVPATPASLSASVAPARLAQGGVDPQKILQAQEFGGLRGSKRYEVALRSAGVLPGGYLTALPSSPFPGSDDGRGNLNGHFVRKMLHYFQANRATLAAMSKRRRAALERTISYGSALTRTKSGLMDREIRLMDGWELFVADGRMGLAAGIWAKQPGRWRTVKPVVMFIRRATYRPRLGVREIAEGADLQSYLEKRLRYHVRKALGE